MRRHASDTAVSNNSWGFPNLGTLQRVSSAWEKAIEDGVENGYGGKGVFYVWSAGNGGGNDYSNLNEQTNHYGVTAVCAVNYKDVRSAYSEKGPNLWLCAPSGDSGWALPRIATTESSDRYTKSFSGTSAAAPIVSGVAALVRAANPDLTWRDVKLILAASARKNDATDDGWREGALQYGSTTERYSHSHRYGFGVVDAGSAVALAQNWTNLPPFRNVSATSSRTVNIPSRKNDLEGVPTVTSSVFLNGHVDFIEYVAVEVTMTHSAIRDLHIELESPSGARSTLTVPRTKPYVGGFFFGSNRGKGRMDNEDFRFGSAVHLGESASGKWTLHMHDDQIGDEGVLHSWKLTAYGHGHSPGAPTITGTTTGNESITVAWAPPDEVGGSGIVGYDVRYIRNDAPDKVEPTNWTVATDVWSSGALSHVLTGLSGGRSYDIQVRAVNDSGPGPWSETLTGNTASVAPGTPIHAYARSLDGAVEVNWKRPAEDGGAAITHYDLRYVRQADFNRPGGPAWTLKLDVASTGSPTSATIDGLQNGVEYWIQVRAVNGTSPGPWTHSFRGAPQAP